MEDASPAQIEMDLVRSRVHERLFDEGLRPVSIGRFSVIGVAGSGGMGVVFVALDPELDRRVAIKLVALGRSGSTASSHARLLTEAQILAKLSHPNIVTVHEVGTHKDEIYVAMEYIDGETLDRWLERQQSRAWREILPVFVQAGRGLDAAHRAGIVHRDFKPSNAMIDRSGRVRVLDFGLADGGGSEQTDEGPTSPLAGTPLYMAPEQLRGASASIAADQFAFCVSLWRALVGEHPFARDSRSATIEAIENGVPNAPSKPVPTWLRRVLTRGLAAAPSDRFTSMRELLEALERGQARARRNRAVLIAAVPALAIAGIAGARQLDVLRDVARCEDAGARDVAGWNDDARVRLRESLLATGASYAEDTADRVVHWLDVHADALQHARTEACLDAEVRGSSDAELLDRASWCLDERRAGREALIDALFDADTRAVQYAVAAAAGLPDPEQCRDVGVLSQLPAPPSDERESVHAVRIELARAHALEYAGKYAPGLEAADAALADARRSSWPPLLAAALMRRASLLQRTAEYAEAEATAQEAYLEAARVGAWAVAAEAATELLYIVGYRRHRSDDGLLWGRHAEIARVHAGDPELLVEARRLGRLGMVLDEAGRHEEARAAIERSLAIKRDVLGPDHPSIAQDVDALAATYLAQSDLPKARALFEEALAALREAYGPDHPAVASSSHNLAHTLLRAGEYEAAAAEYEHALGLLERIHGPAHPDLAYCLLGLGGVELQLGHRARAKAVLERAVEILEASPSAREADLASVLSNLGNVYFEERDFDRAMPLFERALAIEEKTLGPNHPNVAISLGSIANIVSVQGRHADAQRMLERAVAIAETAAGPDHPTTAMMLRNLADVHHQAGDDAGALPLVERAVAIFDRHDGDQQGEPGGRFLLARTLMATAGSPDRALLEATHALAQYRTVANARDIERVEAWLAVPLDPH